MLGLCWRMLAYIGPMLSHLGGYVGPMLGICYAIYVKIYLPIQFFTIFPSRKAKTMEKPTFF